MIKFCFGLLLLWFVLVHLHTYIIGKSFVFLGSSTKPSQPWYISIIPDSTVGIQCIVISQGGAGKTYWIRTTFISSYRYAFDIISHWFILNTISYIHNLSLNWPMFPFRKLPPHHQPPTPSHNINLVCNECDQKYIIHSWGRNKPHCLLNIEQRCNENK